MKFWEARNLAEMNLMGRKNSSLFGIVGKWILIISLGIWISSIPFEWVRLLLSNSTFGLIFKIALTVFGLFLLILFYRNREQYVEFTEEEGLSFSVSLEVFKNLISKVLGTYDDVSLNKVILRKAKLEGLKELVVDLGVTNPFSLSEELKEINEKINAILKQSIGANLGINTVIKVRSFELHG